MFGVYICYLVTGTLYVRGLVEFDGLSVARNALAQACSELFILIE